MKKGREIADQGSAAEKQKEKALFELAKRFRSSKDSNEAKELGNEVGQLVFGE